MKGAEWHGAGYTPRERARRAHHERWLKAHRARCEKMLRELRRDMRRAPPKPCGPLAAIAKALFGR